MSVSIRRRVTRTGEPRFIVRYRLGGRAFPVQHGGTFSTKRLAEVRRDVVAGEIAAGRNPRVLLDQLKAAPPILRTFEDWCEVYRASRVDVGDATRTSIGVHTRAMLAAFGSRDPHTLTTSDVQDWIAGLSVKASSARKYVATLRLVLDYAQVSPNPARDARVRLPRVTHSEVMPPSASEVASIVAHTPKRWRLALRTLAGTGLRASELHQLEWQDVDVAGSRFRIRSGKTAAARRWAAVPPELMAEILETTPPDDRTTTRRVFIGAVPNTVRNAMWRACKSAGTAAYSPHDLRHRYASVQIARGVPVTTLAAQLGHTKKSMTLDTYSHVLLDEGSL